MDKRRGAMGKRKSNEQLDEEKGSRRDTGMDKDKDKERRQEERGEEEEEEKKKVSINLSSLSFGFSESRTPSSTVPTEYHKLPHPRLHVYLCEDTH